VPGEKDHADSDKRDGFVAAEIVLLFDDRNTTLSSMRALEADCYNQTLINSCKSFPLECC
jgi:hypothetical protein